MKLEQTITINQCQPLAEQTLPLPLTFLITERVHIAYSSAYDPSLTRTNFPNDSTSAITIVSILYNRTLSRGNFPDNKTCAYPCSSIIYD